MHCQVILDALSQDKLVTDVTYVTIFSLNWCCIFSKGYRLYIGYMLPSPPRLPSCLHV